MITYIDKENARIALRKAVYHGQVIKPSACSDCATTSYKRLEAHHPDYTKPLDVEWLCTICHRSRHPKAVPNRLGWRGMYMRGVMTHAASVAHKLVD